MPAVLLSRLYYHKQLGIGDVQIVSCDTPELFGYDDPAMLAGRFMSDLQPAWARAWGRKRWVLRELGLAHHIRSDYATVVETPDGTCIGQWRELAGVMRGKEPGEVFYLTYLDSVQELDTCPVLDLASYGVSRAQAEEITGRLTVRDVRTALERPKSQVAKELDNLDFIQDIIRECEALSSTVFAGRYPSALDLMLDHSRVSISWNDRRKQKAERSLALVRVRESCAACGYQWYAAKHTTRQCTRCRKWKW